MGVITINCDMCGKEGRLFKTDVEGSILNLCERCSKFGKVIAAVRVESKPFRKKLSEVRKENPEKEELVLTIVPDYGDIIKNKREQLGMKQEDFAKSINEKQALIHKIETGHFEPPIELAKKIEKILHIKLIEMEEVKGGAAGKPKEDHFTIGDFIKVRRR